MPFICVIDTLCDGLIASWRDEDGKPCIYETEEEARKDASDGDWLVDEPDMVVEVVTTETKIYDPVDGRVYWEEK